MILHEQELPARIDAKQKHQEADGIKAGLKGADYWFCISRLIPETAARESPNTFF